MTESVAQDQLRAFVERIERLEEEQKAINDDKKEVYAEAKGNGFDTKVLKRVVAIRRQDRSEYLEQEAILDLYMAALGMQSGRADDDEDEPRAPAPARAREIIEDFDPKTGEITEPANSASTEVAAVPADTTAESGDASPSVAAPVYHQDPGVDALPESVAVHEAGSEEGSQPLLPSHRVENKPDGPAVMVAAPIPGQVWTERAPRVAVHWHDYARCFPEHWGPGLAAMTDDIRENGVRVPIVKIGDAVLDGRGRYCAARELGIEYPVKEYDGSDPLADVIRWNLEARPNLSTGQRKNIATQLAKLEPARAADIAEMFGLHVDETRKAVRA